MVPLKKYEIFERENKINTNFSVLLIKLFFNPSLVIFVLFTLTTQCVN